jgi:hypothetical protein
MASSDSNHCALRDSSLGEMEIVDTFTKLIFGMAEDFSVRELDIIATLRLVDANISLDELEEMGTYLRALGVKEMIKLVTLVQQNFPPQGQTQFPASPHQPVRF